MSIASDALIGAQNTVTDALGSYKFLVLPPGAHSVTFSMSGFQTRTQENVAVKIGSTNRVDSVMTGAFTDEVQVKSGSYSAEYGRATGSVINVITKSGGNEFHGDVFGYYDSPSTQASLKGDAIRGPITATSVTKDFTRSDSAWEADLHLGYPIRLGSSLELNVLVDIFNVFNRQGELRRDIAYTKANAPDDTYEVIDWDTGLPLPPITPGDADRPPTGGGWNTTDRWQDPTTIRLGLRLSF